MKPSSAEPDPQGPEFEIPQALTIANLRPSSTVTTVDGDVEIHSPSTTLIALQSHDACLLPDRIDMTEGNVLLIPPAYPCRLKTLVSLPIRLAAVDISLKYQGLDVSFALPDVPAILSGNDAKQLRDDISVVCNSLAGKLGPSQAAERLAAGYRMAHTIFTIMGLDSNPVLSHDDSDLHRLHDYLLRNHHLPLSVEDMAMACGVSRRQVFKIAAKLDKFTPMRLLKKIRLEESLKLLRNEQLSIARISSMTGFANPKNFSREFKREYGMPPLRHRQQWMLGTHVANLVQKADMNLQGGVWRRASILYLKAIESAPSWTDVDELHFKAGLALRQGGEVDRAAESWKRVSSLYYRLRIDLEKCEGVHRGEDHRLTLEQLRRIYENGNKALRQNVAERLGEWMLQCAIDEKMAAARDFSEFAKEIVIHHRVLEPRLARTLFMTGQYEDVDVYCPLQRCYIANSLRAMGKYEEHLERFPELRPQCASLHFRMGQYERVLDEYPDVEHQCARGLVALERFEEAIERYPQNNVQALLALGRYEDALKLHPDDPNSCMWALEKLGRHDEAMAQTGSDLFLKQSLALYRRDTRGLLSLSIAEGAFRMGAEFLLAIQFAQDGRHDHSLEMLESVRSVTEPAFDGGHGLYYPDLLIPAMRQFMPAETRAAFQSRWPDWKEHYADIVKHHRYRNAQKHWHEMSLILGEIGDAEFHAQPNRGASKTEILFAKALHEDLDGQSNAAADLYREYQSTVAEPKYYAIASETFFPLKQAFIDWRLGVLSKG